jgi:hypothetical protein
MDYCRSRLGDNPPARLTSPPESEYYWESLWDAQHAEAVLSAKGEG